MHHQGRNLFFCTNKAELISAVGRCGAGYYVSEFIDKAAEYRVFCGSGRAVAVAKKTPGNPGDVAWNVARGGSFDNVRFDDWPLNAVKYALKAHKLTGLDFSGVDVMVDAQGMPYVLEVNSAPSLTSPYRQQCFAKLFDYIILNGHTEIPIIQEPGGYRKFIHPCISDRAIV